jgi:hypothetical protein
VGVAWTALYLGYWWLCLLLAMPAAGFLVRLFMIQHDCGHGSFFHNRSANDWVGRVIGVLTRIETMKGPAESGQICSVGRRKVAKKIAKNKRCYANTLRPRSRMLLKVMKGG